MNDIDELRVSYKRDGFALIRYDDGPVHSYPYDAPWLTDDDFDRLYESVRHNSLVDRIRCYHLFLLTHQALKTDGDILEVGSWRGGTAGLLAQMAPDRTVYLADTFQGVVKASPWEHYADGAHSDTSEGLVRKYLGTELNLSNYEILAGVFPDETGGMVAGKQFSLVHLDVDVYQSTKDAFEYIWAQVCQGGIVVFDDYGMVSACEGISRFVLEIKDDGDKLFVPNLNGQAYVIKVS